MRYVIILILGLVANIASAQQVNPVPDYTFANRMSAGRNTVTDTAAYFSIGPRYGATKGFMPPIVGDTATFSSGKRNGLLIFSVQKNKFLYWDSVRVQWSDMAGSSGAYIVAGDTAAMLLPYLRKADTTAMLSPYYRSATATAALALKVNISDTSTMLGNYIRHAGYGLTKSGQGFLVDTLNISTRAWRQKGIDSVAALVGSGTIGGSGTTNYIPKFTGASTIGNSIIFDNGTNVGIGTASPAANLHIDGGASNAWTRYTNANNTTGFFVGASADGEAIIYQGANNYLGFFTNSTERLRIFANGRVFVGASPVDNGYQLDVNGTLRSVNGANFATTSGNVGIGTASPAELLHLSKTGAGVVGPNLRLHNTSARQIGNAARISFAPNADYTSTAIAGYIDVIDTDGVPANFAAMVFGVGSGGSPSERMRITTTGNVGIGTTSPTSILQANGTITAGVSGGSNGAFDIKRGSDGLSVANYSINTTTSLAKLSTAYTFLTFETEGTERMRLSGGNLGIGTESPTYKLDITGDIRTTTDAFFATSSGRVYVGTTSDAGDYKLQVVGNARIGTGKLDIASNDYYGISVSRTGTDVIAQQIYNSNGTLYFGAENSTGGGIFSGSSAYAAVIGSGANHPLQFATNNATRATIDTDGDLGIATTTPTEKLDVNGRARIRTVDSTSTAINMLYADVNGVIKKAPVGSSGVSGSGTTNYIPKFTGSTALGNSVLYEASSELFVNTTNDQGAYALQVNGSVYNTGQVTRGAFNLIGTGAQFSTDSTTNLSPLYLTGQSLTGSSAQALIYGNATWNTSGTPSLIDINLTNTSSSSDANYIKITDGTNLFRVTKDAGIITAAPSGGNASKWKLGSVVGGSVTLNSGQYIEVEVAGALYRLAVVTLN